MCFLKKKKPIKLPPSWPYNHAIKLKDMRMPQWAKAYLLNPIKHQACKQFIEEHLKTGKIFPLKFPQAVPFFFIKKKEAGKFHPCQDYRYLNSHTIKNTYPLSLISNLIKPEDWWKAAFTTPLGLFKPNVMFFRMCMLCLAQVGMSVDLAGSRVLPV